MADPKGPILAEPADTIDTMDLLDLQGPVVANDPPVAPKMTAQVVVAVVADLIVVEERGGYHGIARIHGLWRSQVAAIDRLRLTRIAELTAVDEPVGIEPKG